MGWQHIEKEDKPLMEIPYEEKVVLIDGREYFSRSTQHIGTLKYYMNDARVSGKLVKTHNSNLHCVLVV